MNALNSTDNQSQNSTDNQIPDKGIGSQTCSKRIKAGLDLFSCGIQFLSFCWRDLFLQVTWHILYLLNPLCIVFIHLLDVFLQIVHEWNIKVTPFFLARSLYSALWHCSSKIYSGTWPVYLMDVLSLRLVEALGAKINVRSSFSLRWLTGFWIRTQLQTTCFTHWAIPLSL